MAFDGASAVQPLDYKGLDAYGIPDGTISEPTNAGLATFLTAMQALAASGEETTGEEALAKVHQAASDLCSGNPTAEQFANVPPRLFREFIKWLASEFTDPKD